MDQIKPADIQKPEVTEIPVYTSTATEPKIVMFENLNKRMVEWLIG